MNSLTSKLLFATTIFISAFALFLVQPIIAKQILPWFGGSATVWAICMVFFQMTLLIGYAYSDFVSHQLKPIHQVIVHVILLLVSLSFLPIVANSQWKPTGDEDPSWLIIKLLIFTIGLPYFLLSTTGPLIQSWVARTFTDSSVYRYFSLSNLASLLALICYPFLIESRAAIEGQAYMWSVAYAIFVLACIGSGIYFLRHVQNNITPSKEESSLTNDATTSTIGFKNYFLWIAPSCMASWMLMAITNHITQNVASIPFLWLLPLTLYLLTFVLCFESDRWYRPIIVWPITAVLMGLCAYGLNNRSVGADIWVAIPLYAAALFFVCMVMHGELSSMRPSSQYLTRFYLMVSVGGAMGGFMISWMAPRVLAAYYELGIGLALVALLMTILIQWKSVKVIALSLSIFCGAYLYLQIEDDFNGARWIGRNFYGTLITADVTDGPAIEHKRLLIHGSIKHGEQYLDASRKKEATAYYGATSGVGLAIANTHQHNQKVGVIGLGAGTLAVYGKKGDVYRLYELNPDVIEIANKEFSFLKDSDATITTVLGDARLSLEKEAIQQFDVLAVDAFTGDSIPVHLVTQQAMTLYWKHMKPQGIIAFHVTNQYLNLAPVLVNIAKQQGLHYALIKDVTDNPSLRDTDWILIAKDPSVLEQTAIRKATGQITPIPKLGIWSDDFNNLLEVTK